MSKPNFYYVGDLGPGYHIECKIAYWLWRTIPLVLLVIGTLGNILNMIILSRKQLRKYSTTTFLLILASTELTVLWTSLLPDTVLSITGERLVDKSAVICRLRWWLGLTSGSCSTWILVLLTAERTLLTRAPVFWKSKVTPRNALIASLIVLFVIATLNSHLIFGLRLYNTSDNGNITKNVTEPQIPFKCYFSSEEYGKFYFQYWYKIVLALYNLIPASIIIIGNLNIAFMLIYRRNKVNPSSNPNSNNRRKSSAKMLFVLSVFYVITTTPWCVYNSLRGKITDYSEESFSKWQLATVVVSIFVWSNFTFNFFLYFVSGTLFKNEWKRLVDVAKNILRKPLQTSTRTRS